MKVDDDAHDFATIMFVVEVFKLHLAHPDETSSGIVERLGRLLDNAEFPKPADSELRKLVDDVIAFDRTPLSSLAVRSIKRKRSSQK